jgi:hypothetical protein
MEIIGMLKEGKVYQIFAGVNLDQAIDSPVTALQSFRHSTSTLVMQSVPS